MSEWQPIETAPRDTPVLVWAKCYGEFSVFAAELDEYDWDVVGATGYEWETAFDTPTHWMPLPAPPMAKGE